MAHVDHGKTTLADSLLASNGLISAVASGRVRFLDFAPEEVKRMITMKACGVALLYARVRVAVRSARDSGC